ncbi:MAG: BNR-4 repeat-containing protein [Planctomycetota bacterium]
MTPEKGDILHTEPDDGYRGVWYYNQPLDSEYRFKYSGGLGTYPQQIHPLACYAPEVGKTFFCYGGSPRTRNEVTHMVSYFDHAVGTVPRPRRLVGKETSDAHDMTALAIDEEGHLWIFSNSHGLSRPSWVHRSTEPYGIEEFEVMADFNFSYSQPWWLPGRGLLLLHTHYTGDERGAMRRLFWRTTRDGRQWSERRLLAFFQRGHYQVSARRGRRVGTAFNHHPEPGGLNERTNLYYLETDDAGKTWRTAGGEPVEMPLEERDNSALAVDWEAEGLLCYLKTLQFDAEGRPVILFLTSPGFESGPANDPRIWRTARWTGQEWRVRDVTTSDNNYDFGPLYVEGNGTWRLIAPTGTGPQPYNPGGEVEMWLSEDEGETWRKTAELTRGSDRNHTYVRRPVNIHPDFYALWADGHARQLSRSCLYFVSRAGDRVRRLPPQMESDSAEPEKWA